MATLQAIDPLPPKETIMQIPGGLTAHNTSTIATEGGTSLAVLCGGVAKRKGRPTRVAGRSAAKGKTAGR
jgi:hypothetical protein